MRAERKDAQALIDCAFAAYELRTAIDVYRNRGAKDAGFDGMPKQHGAARGLDDALIKEQSAEEKLHEKHAAFLRARRRAEKALDRIVMGQAQQGEHVKGMRGFLSRYYLEGMAMKAAWREAGVTERTARRYKAEIVRAANNKKKPG